MLDEPIIPSDVVIQRKRAINGAKLINGTYIYDKNNKHIQTLKKIILNCDKKCDDILIVSSMIFSTVFNYYKGALRGDFGDNFIDKKELLKGIGVLGYAGIESYKDPFSFNGTRLQVIAGDELFKINDEYVRIQNYSIKDLVLGDEKHFMYLKYYTLGKNINKLYLLGDSKNSYGKEVSLDTLDIFKNLPEEEILQPDKYGIKIIDSNDFISTIEPTVLSIDRKINGLDVDLLKFGFKSQKVLTGKKISSEQAQNDILHLETGGDIKFVEKPNKNVQGLMDFIVDQKKSISGAAQVPRKILGLDDESVGVGAESKKDNRNDFIQVITDIENQIDEAFQYFNIDEPIKWEAVIKDDDITVLNVIKEAVSLGLMSKIDSIMKFYNMDKEQAEIKLLELSEKITTTDETIQE